MCASPNVHTWMYADMIFWKAEDDLFAYIRVYMYIYTHISTHNTTYVHIQSKDPKGPKLGTCTWHSSPKRFGVAASSWNPLGLLIVPKRGDSGDGP